MKTYEDISKDLGDIEQENAAIVDEQRELDGIKRYEEAVVKVELAREIQNESGDPHNFDKNIFKNKREALKNEIDNANQEGQKQEIENKIRLLNDLQNKANDENSLEGAVNTIITDGNKIIRSFYERKGESVDITDPNQLEAHKKRLLEKDKPRLQKNKDWKDSRANKTNVIEHQAYWENTKENMDFEKLDKSKETYENLKDLGHEDLAEQFKTSSYKDRLSKAYNTLKTGYEEVENKKSEIDKKIGTLSQKLWGEPISPEEKKKIEEEVENLKTESVALRKIIDEQVKTLEDLDNKHNLSDILGEETADTPEETNTNEDVEDTEEGEEVGETDENNDNEVEEEDVNEPAEEEEGEDTEEEEENSNDVPEAEDTRVEATLNNSQKRLYKIIAAAAGGVAGAGIAVGIASSGGLAVAIPFMVSGFMTIHTRAGRSGKIPLVSRWLDRSVSGLENRISDPNIEAEERAKLMESLRKRKKAIEVISSCTRPFMVGSQIGLLFGGVSGVASSGMLEQAMANTYGAEAADLSWMGNETLARGASAAAGAATVPIAEAGQRMRERRTRSSGN